MFVPIPLWIVLTALTQPKTLFADMLSCVFANFNYVFAQWIIFHKTNMIKTVTFNHVHPFVAHDWFAIHQTLCGVTWYYFLLPVLLL